MYSEFGTSENIQKILDDMQVADYNGLSVYRDQGLKIDRLTFTLYDAAWHWASARVAQQVFGQRCVMGISSFPSARIVFTDSREVFLDLYHNQTQRDQLPGWVTNYANVNHGIYVVLLDGRDNSGCSYRSKRDEAAHEFLHLLLPDQLDVDPEDCYIYLPSWVKEGICVKLNQQQKFRWFAEVPHNIVTSLSLAGISTNGFWYYDERPPDENVAYQYCAQAVQLLGMKAFGVYDAEETYLDGAGPLLPVFILAHEACIKGIPFEQHLADRGIDMNVLENTMKHAIRATRSQCCCDMAA